MAKAKGKTKSGTVKGNKTTKKPKKKPFQCTVCSKAFTDRSDLYSHSAKHSNETPFHCNLCPYKAKTKKYLARHHKKVHTDQKQHKCSYCGKCFHHPCDLKEHVMVHTGEKPHKCNVCGKSFRVTYSLNSHMLIHTDEKPFRCSFCDYACRDSSTLRKHQNKHMGLESAYRCKICSKSYKMKWLLKMHVNEAHLDVDLKKIPCEECGKLFKTISKRNFHVRSVHKRALACTCPTCGLRLASRHNLAGHMRRHLAERPFACSHPGCGVAFKNKGCLQKHAKIHDPSKHFACSHCGRKFVRKCHVKRHEMVMHVERARRIECDYCGAKFYTKNYLIKHIQTKHIHKQKFKYICDICGLKTHNKPSIVMHLKYGHLNDHDLQCKLCDNKVVYKKHMYLKLHYWKTHNVRYKITRRNNKVKEETKPNIEVKVEPVEAESYEEIQLLDVNKMEVDEDNDSLVYSKSVLSEDLSALVFRDGKLEGKEVDFDDFYIKHIMAKQEQKPAEEPKNTVIINHEQDQYVKNKINQIIIRTRKLEEARALRKKKKEEESLREERERREIVELRRVREMYNERMKAALLRERERKEHVKIKHFKKLEVSKTLVVRNDGKANKTDKQNNLAIGDEISDVTDDDNDNTPLNSLINKTSKSVDDNDTGSAKSDESKKSDNIEKNLGKEYNENTTDIENINVNEGIIDNNSISVDSEIVISQQIDVEDNNINDEIDGTDEIDLLDAGNTVQSNEPSHDKNNFVLQKHGEFGGGDICYTDHNYIRCIDKGRYGEKCEKRENNDKNHDHTYVKNIENYDETSNKAIQETTNKELIQNNVTEYDKVTDNDKSVSNETNKVTENEITITNAYYNDVDDDTGENNDNNDTNNENNDNDVTNGENNDNDVTNDKNNDKESLNSDGDITKPLMQRKSKRTRKVDSDYEVNDDNVDVCKKTRKMEFKTHQCYVCFKLYQTKNDLITHCEEHFDLCNDRTLSKCPICSHVSYKIGQHMKLKHKVNIKIPFNKITERNTTDGSKYCYEVDGTEIEVIPSIKILNKTASMAIDKKKRERNDQTIAKSKLVKKGDEWIVEKEYIDLSFDELPELTDIELTKCKVTDDDIDRLGQISKIAKKKGLKMMFPCFKCEKVCQNFSALKLHKRRHEDNPKPFARRVKNGLRSIKKDVKVKLDKANRTAFPKPIKCKHKCDDKLKEFFESNIRGGDIEFWQFLKIFNKMDREKVNDFKDLEARDDFGNHLDYYKDDEIVEDCELAEKIDKCNEIDEDTDGDEIGVKDAVEDVFEVSDDDE